MLKIQFLIFSGEICKLFVHEKLIIGTGFKLLEISQQLIIQLKGFDLIPSNYLETNKSTLSLVS